MAKRRNKAGVSTVDALPTSGTHACTTRGVGVSSGATSLHVGDKLLKPRSLNLICPLLQDNGEGTRFWNLNVSEQLSSVIDADRGRNRNRFQRRPSGTRVLLWSALGAMGEKNERCNNQRAGHICVHG